MSSKVETFSLLTVPSIIAVVPTALAVHNSQQA